MMNLFGFRFFLFLSSVAFCSLFYFFYSSQIKKPKQETSESQRIGNSKEEIPSLSPLPSSPQIKKEGLKVTEIDPTAQEKIKLLEEILEAKNDNDPRLDYAFLDLTKDTKEHFQQKFYSLPKEALNERGTIIFLLGKNLAEERDFEFLSQVVKDPPCASMTRCSPSSSTQALSSHADHEKVHKDSHAHDSMAETVTLVYPQMVALRSAQSFIRANLSSSPKTLCQAIRIVQAAKTSTSQSIVSFAVQILSEIPSQFIQEGGCS